MGLFHLKGMQREVEYLLRFYLRIRQYASFRTNTATMQGRKVQIHPQILSFLKHFHNNYSFHALGLNHVLLPKTLNIFLEKGKRNTIILQFVTQTSIKWQKYTN